MQHWATCYNAIVAGTAAAPTAAAAVGSSSSSSKVCYSKKVLTDLAAATEPSACDNDVNSRTQCDPMAPAPGAAAATASSSTDRAASLSPCSAAAQSAVRTSTVLPTAPAAAVAPAPLGWSKDAAAFLSNSTSSGSSGSAAAGGAQHSRSWCAGEVITAADTNLGSKPSPTRSATAAAPAAAAANIHQADSTITATNKPTVASQDELQSSLPIPAESALLELGHIEGTGLTSDISRISASALSGLTIQPGCASLTVLPFTDASSTAAEADETASLQPSISIASTTSTVVSSCLSTHAASFKEKPSWHGMQHAVGPAVAAVSSSSSAVTAPATAAAAAATGEAVALASKLQQQQKDQAQEQQQQQSPATPTTPEATAAAPATPTITTPDASPTFCSRSAAHVTDAATALSHPKPFLYTPEPLYATRVLPNSWLGGFKAAAAAVAQVKAEQRHIKQTLLQRQGLLPATKPSLFGFGGGSKTGEQALGVASAAAAVLNKNVSSSSTVKGMTGAGSSSSSSKMGHARPKAAAVLADTSSLSTQLLHIPEATLQKLKVSGWAPKQQTFCAFIS
jgi:hypothetical protein